MAWVNTSVRTIWSDCMMENICQKSGLYLFNSTRERITLSPKLLHLHRKSFLLSNFWCCVLWHFWLAFTFLKELPRWLRALVWAKIKRWILISVLAAFDSYFPGWSQEREKKPCGYNEEPIPSSFFNTVKSPIIEQSLIISNPILECEIQVKKMHLSICSCCEHGVWMFKNSSAMGLLTRRGC